MLRKSRVVLGAAIAMAIGAGAAGNAQAAFPNYGDCPTSNVDVRLCVDIQSTNGFLRIKDFTVPIGTSFGIRGGVTSFNTGNTFVAPRGTTGVFAKPIRVPGGLLGINFWIPGNSVTATAALAGRPSDIRIDLSTLSVSVPVKLELSNVLLGMACQIGSNSAPVRLNLGIAPTNPPAPNRPIEGRVGTFEPAPTNDGGVLRANTHVANDFAIPSANSCGLGLGLINSLVNAKMKLPSSAGNNEIQVENDLGMKYIF